MLPPTFRQGETVEFRGQSITGKVVKVIRHNNTYLYRVKVESVKPGVYVFFTVSADELYR